MRTLGHLAEKVCIISKLYGSSFLHCDCTAAVLAVADDAAPGCWRLWRLVTVVFEFWSSLQMDVTYLSESVLWLALTVWWYVWWVCLMQILGHILVTPNSGIYQGGPVSHPWPQTITDRLNCSCCSADRGWHSWVQWTEHSFTLCNVM